MPYKFTAIFMTVLALMSLICYLATDYPDVYISSSTGECVKVISDNPDTNCFNFPVRYNRILVR